MLELLDLNIRQLISKNNRQGLPAWTCVKFASDILKFLVALHKMGYVHGDLKPGNIMWSGQEGCFKCFDFGLSYRVSDRSKHVIQSPGYRAPEIVRGNKSCQELSAAKRNNNQLIRPDRNENGQTYIDGSFSSHEDRPGTKTDIWAFGCLLFETIAGRKLFRAGDRLSSVLRWVLHILNW